MSSGNLRSGQGHIAQGQGISFPHRRWAVLSSVLLAIAGFAVFRLLVTDEVLELVGPVVIGTLSGMCLYQAWERSTLDDEPA